ncbi:Protein PHLOEM PROTEIN 2-LIKE A9 [Linum perenne]
MEEERNMAGAINLINEQGTKSAVVDLTGAVHNLPCCIKYDGPSDVSDYFKPKPSGLEVDGLAVQQAYFRGRMLQGATIPIPHGYSGFVLGKKSLGKRKASECNSNCWESSAKFEKITYWNHDTLPSQDDTFIRSLHWLPIAEAVSSALEVGTLCNSQQGRSWWFKPKAFNIVWGNDDRYWRVPKDGGAAELLQVSWLEVSSINTLDGDIQPGKKYVISFRLQMKQGAFGWNGCTVYLMTKIGQSGKYTAKKIKLADQPEMDKEFDTEKLEVTVPADATDKKLYFGLYEVWTGRWKGGLLIHGATVEDITDK